METLFPDILFLGPFFVPLLLRIGIAVVFLAHAYSLSSGGKREKISASFSGILGIFFALGLLTQLVAMVGALYVFLSSSPLLPRGVFSSRAFSFLVFVVLVSLFISGAGAFAFDLPY